MHRTRSQDRLNRRGTIPWIAVGLLLSAPLDVTRGAPGDDASPARELGGRVVIAASERPVKNAVVTLVELDRRTATDAEGNFLFVRVPRGTFTLGVHAVGFASIHRAVRIPPTEVLIVELNPDVHFQEEVTVTALPWVASPLDSPQSVDMVDQQKINGEGINSIGGALEHVPGVANIGTGDALGTPVIRGISESRIRVLNDGIAANYQQWSFRHSPNIEPALAERIEVVRGPASVMWGPDAMGGVINVIRPPLPSAAKGETALHGDLGLGYFNNTGQLEGRAVLEGALGGFGWRAGVVGRDAGDIVTPDGTLENTDYSQLNPSATVGYTGTWGSVRLRWDRWDNDVGYYFPVGNPMDEFRLELRDNTLSADLTLPTNPGDVRVVVSRQGNSRQAFNPAAPAYPAAAVDMELDTTTARAGLAHKRLGAWKGKVSVEYQGLGNTTLASTLLPDYDAQNVSLMVFEEGRFAPAREGDFERFVLNLGLRGDRSNLRVPPGQPQAPDGFDRDYNAVTGSLGLVFRPTQQFSLAANLGRGWRPPNAFELFADGVHGGVAAYQVGNPDLTEESNLSAELSARFQSPHWRAVVTGFCSDFSDFIHLFDTGASDDPSGLPVFSYAQDDATIDGIEGSLEVVPLEQLQLGLVYSNVNTRNDGTGTRLPQTPPERIRLSVRGMTPALGPLVDPFIELQGVWVADGVPSGPDEPYWASGNAATESYDLWHLRAGFRITTRTGVIGVDVTIRNLLDATYTDFLYPYKVWGVPNPGRDVRIVGRFQF